MTTPVSGGAAQDAVVDGVNVESAAAVVLECAGVSGLAEGPFGEVATYLPGRTVAGIRVGGGRVTVSIRCAWGVPVAEVATLIRAVLVPVTGLRPVDVVVADIDDPPDLPASGAALLSG